METLDAKKAFKLGVACAYAQHGISHVDAFEAHTKLATGLVFGLPLAAMGTGLVTSTLSLPASIGSAVGGAMSSADDDEVRNPKTLRQQHLIAKYKQLIREQQIRLHNKVVDEALALQTP